MKFSDLPQAPSGGSYAGWIMHVPVINRRHLPPAEVEIIQKLQPGRCGTFEDPPLLAHIFNGKGHLFFVTDMDAGDLTMLPILEKLLLLVREKGYEECRLDIDGTTFEDLELFPEEVCEEGTHS